MRTDNHNSISAAQAIWAFLSSMHTAAVTLFVLAAASIPGATIQQLQAPEFYAARYGAHAAAIIAALRLDDAYHSVWYMAILALVGLNLAACSINRFGRIWRRTFAPEVETDASRVSAMAASETVLARMSLDKAVSLATRSLARSYRISTHSGGHTVALYAVRGRLRPWGPYMTHLSILLIFAGAVIGHFTGAEGRLAIAEGESASQYYTEDGRSARNLPMRLSLERFVLGHDADHIPTAFRSDLVVHLPGAAPERRAVEVNRPLSRGGLTFYQTAYGIAGVQLRVIGPDGKSASVQRRIEQDEDGAYFIPDNDVAALSVAGKRIGVFIHGFEPDFVPETEASAGSDPLHPAVQVMLSDHYPAKGMNDWTPLGWVPLHGTAKAGAYRVEFTRAPYYTVLSVSRNPGLPLVYAGLAALLLGVAVSFYVPQRVVRVHLAATDSGVRATIGASARGGEPMADDVCRVKEALS